MNNYEDLFYDKTLFITGGCGSFGKFFVKDVLKYHPRKIIIYSRDEFKHAQFEQEMQGKHDDQLRFILGDIRDKDVLTRAMIGADYVIHTAALKRIERGEYNPDEFIKTNIDGTSNVIWACLANGIDKAVLLSTDKAVNPKTLYGSTKYTAEKLFQAGMVYSPGHKLKLSICRYGNVIDSRGSVIPLFRELSKKQDFLPVTHTDMTRFVITMKQAISLVYDCLENMRGGEIYIPKIPSIKIMYLVEAFEKKAKIIGIRAYEKIHEQLIDEDDICYEYKNKYILYPNYDWYNIYERLLPGGSRISINLTSDNNNFLSVDEIRMLIND